MQDDAVGLVIALLGGNLAYLIGTIVLASIYSVTPDSLVNGPLTFDMASIWLSVGGLLGVVDVLAVVGFVAAVMPSGR